MPSGKTTQYPASAPNDVSGLRADLVNWLQSRPGVPASQGGVFGAGGAIPRTITGAPAGNQAGQGPYGWQGAPGGTSPPGGTPPGGIVTGPTPWNPTPPGTPGGGGYTLPGGSPTNNPWVNPPGLGAPPPGNPMGGPFSWNPPPIGPVPGSPGFPSGGGTSGPTPISPNGPYMTPVGGVPVGTQQSPGLVGMNLSMPAPGGAVQGPRTYDPSIGAPGLPTPTPPGPAPAPQPNLLPFQYRDAPDDDTGTGWNSPASLADWQRNPLSQYFSSPLQVAQNAATLGLGQRKNPTTGEIETPIVINGQLQGWYSGSENAQDLINRGALPSTAMNAYWQSVTGTGIYAPPGTPPPTTGGPTPATPSGVGTPQTTSTGVATNPNLGVTSGLGPNVLASGTPPNTYTTQQSFVPHPQGWEAWPGQPAPSTWTRNWSQQPPTTDAEWQQWAAETLGPGGVPINGFLPPGSLPGGSSNSGPPLAPGSPGGPGGPPNQGGGGVGPFQPSGATFDQMFNIPFTAQGEQINPFVSAAGGPEVQSVDQLGGANSAFFQNMVNQLAPSFDQRRNEGLAAAKESAGNLTGSGFANILGSSINRSLGDERAALANYAVQGLQNELQRQMFLNQQGQNLNQFNAGGQNAQNLSQAQLFQQANMTNAGYANQVAGQNQQAFLQTLLGLATGGVSPPQIGVQEGAGNFIGQLLAGIIGLRGGA